MPPIVRVGEMKRDRSEVNVAVLVGVTVAVLLTAWTPLLGQGGRILETTQAPTALDHTDPAWAGSICGGKTAFTLGGAKYEWTPVVSGFGQWGSVEPVTGWAIGAHRSGADVPFTHPFGKV